MSDESSVSEVLVPETWIEPMSTSAGFLPSVGIHLREGKLIQETSRSVWIGATIMCGIGLLALIPISWLGVVFRTSLINPYFIQCFVSLVFFWGAFCAVVVTGFIQKNFGVSATLDLQSQNICIQRKQRKLNVPTSQVIGLQVLRGPKEKGGHQLNLVFRTESGEVVRESLHTNVIRSYVVRIAKAYQQFAGWPIFEASGL